MPKIIENKENKNICSHCHKWNDYEEFYRYNWKNTAKRYFKICNTCDRKKKISLLDLKVEQLNKDFDYKYNFMSPEIK